MLGGVLDTELRGSLVVITKFFQRGKQTLRKPRAAKRSETLDLAAAHDRNDAGHDGNGHPELGEMVAELEKQLAKIERAELARQSLEAFGALIVVRDRDEAAQLANVLATEHLHIACAEPEELLVKIRNAGAVFLGPFSAVALGDYVAGPSHVLPTRRAARFSPGNCRRSG